MKDQYQDQGATAVAALTAAGIAAAIYITRADRALQRARAHLHHFGIVTTKLHAAEQAETGASHLQQPQRLLMVDIAKDQFALLAHRRRNIIAMIKLHA